MPEYAWHRDPGSNAGKDRLLSILNFLPTSIASKCDFIPCHPLVPNSLHFPSTTTTRKTPTCIANSQPQSKQFYARSSRSAASLPLQLQPTKKQPLPRELGPGPHQAAMAAKDGR